MNNRSGISEPGVIIIDVRAAEEYAGGHLEWSINVPLHEIPARLNELKEQNIIVCCASGIRSNKAASLLKQNGITCRDGGSWLDLKNSLTINQE